MKVAIIGAGWAGCSAAVAAAQSGLEVHVFEAARTLGGRARSLKVPATDPNPGHETRPELDVDGRFELDNGQHVMIGAYTQTLALLRQLGVDVDNAFHRQPLRLKFPDGSGLALPDCPPPWDALWAVSRAKGWSWSDKFSFIRTLRQWQAWDFLCSPMATVSDLCGHLSPVLQQGVFELLCVSALNTAMHEASGQVFLNVIKDSLFAGPGGSNLLIPKVSLSQLLPLAMQQRLATQGQHSVRLGNRVGQLHRQGPHWHVQGEPFDAVVLATDVSAAKVLLQSCLASSAESGVGLHHPLSSWINRASTLQFEAIATLYARAETAALAHTGFNGNQPYLALRSNARHPAQFVFNHQRLTAQPGLLAFVVSAAAGDKALLEQQVTDQARVQLGMSIHPIRTIVEKRATFRCTTPIARPGPVIAAGLVAAGDYIDSPYPATLEAAVRSGFNAVELLLHPPAN